MNKLFFMLIIFCSFVGTISAQNRLPGITLKTTKRGTNPIDMPHDDTERHNIKLTSIENDYEFRILLQNFVNGKYIPSDRDMERIATGRLRAKGNLVFEVTPELKNDNNLCKVFFFFPQMYLYRLKVVSESSKNCIKFLFFDFETQIRDDVFMPMLLIYEDNRTTGDNEKKLETFVTNGKLTYFENTYKFIEQNIENYTLLYYKTTKIKPILVE